MHAPHHHPGAPGPSTSGAGPSTGLSAGTGGKGGRPGGPSRRAVSPGHALLSRPAPGALAAASALTTAARPAPVRTREKFVPLPGSEIPHEEVELELAYHSDTAPGGPGVSAHAPALVQRRGRITVITVAESFNRKALEAALQLQQLELLQRQPSAGQPVPPGSTAATTTQPTPTPVPSTPAASVSGMTLPTTSTGGAAACASPLPAAATPTGGASPLPTGATSPLRTSAAAASALSSAAVAAAAAAKPGAGPGVTTAVTAYPEVTYARTAYGEAMEAPADVFFFDYGVVAMWGLTEAQEQALLGRVVRSPGVAVGLLDDAQVEELLFVYSLDSPPNIRNDTFTIDSRLASDHRVKMAISHALAQSAKLAVYEERMVALVEEVRHVPVEMAERGAISLSNRHVAMLMGKVFLLKAAVNLTATMLGTPEYFWRAPDQLQALYERACEYLDIDSRLDMLNARCLVLQRMLDIWSDHSHHQTLAALDLVIVILILIEVLMGGMEVVGFVVRRRGWHWHSPPLGARVAAWLWGGAGAGGALVAAAGQSAAPAGHGAGGGGDAAMWPRLVAALAAGLLVGAMCWRYRCGGSGGRPGGRGWWRPPFATL